MSVFKEVMKEFIPCKSDNSVHDWIDDRFDCEMWYATSTPDYYEYECHHPDYWDLTDCYKCPIYKQWKKDMRNRDKKYRRKTKRDN